jgi:hypothetical protein
MSSKVLLTIVLFFAVICAACSDRDREMSRRQSDGSETFKYVVPTKDNPTGLKKNSSPQKPEAKKDSA